jgi:hypothetical protein
MLHLFQVESFLIHRSPITFFLVVLWQWGQFSETIKKIPNHSCLQ